PSTRRRRNTWSVPARKCSVSAAAARLDSAFGSCCPPESILAKALTPSAAPATSASTLATSTQRARRTMNLPRLSNIWCPSDRTCLHVTTLQALTCHRMCTGVNIKGVTTTAKTRRYHHGDLRNALVRAAAELAETGGPEAVTVRAA